MSSDYRSALRGVVSDLDSMAISGARPSDLDAVARRVELIADALSEATATSAVKATLVKIGMKSPALRWPVTGLINVLGLRNK